VREWGEVVFLGIGGEFGELGRVMFEDEDAVWSEVGWGLLNKFFDEGETVVFGE